MLCCRLMSTDLSLVSLFVDYNQLTRLPPTLTRLTQLTRYELLVAFLSFVFDQFALSGSLLATIRCQRDLQLTLTV